MSRKFQFNVKTYAPMLIALIFAACSDEERENARLASGCINASDDNRVKLSGSWSNNFEVELVGEEVTVRTEVPVGIGLDGKVKFRSREFRCRKRGEQLEYLGTTWH